MFFWPLRILACYLKTVWDGLTADRRKDSLQKIKGQKPRPCLRRSGLGEDGATMPKRARGKEICDLWMLPPGLGQDDHLRMDLAI